MNDWWPLDSTALYERWISLLWCQPLVDILVNSLPERCCCVSVCVITVKNQSAPCVTSLRLQEPPVSCTWCSCWDWRSYRSGPDWGGGDSADKQTGRMWKWNRIIYLKDEIKNLHFPLRLYPPSILGNSFRILSASRLFTDISIIFTSENEPDQWILSFWFWE